MTLAAYAISVSLAYATLAGLPPQVGIYGYLLGGLGYALLGSSRQLAIGPTSAISLMIAATVAGMANGDAQRYAQIASIAMTQLPSLFAVPGSGSNFFERVWQFAGQLGDAGKPARQPGRTGPC